MSSDVRIPADANLRMVEIANELETLANRLRYRAGKMKAESEEYQTLEDFYAELDEVEAFLDGIINGTETVGEEPTASLPVIRNHLEAYERRQKEKQAEENHE